MLLEMNRDVEVNADFWTTIKGLILQGQFDIARALLKMHSKSETTAFQAADEILRTMPLFSVRKPTNSNFFGSRENNFSQTCLFFFQSYGGLSLQKFQAQRQYWITNVETRIQSGKCHF